MDSIRHSVEASFARPREVIMEERYRRLHYDPTAAPHYWAHAPSKAVALGRFRRHLPVVPKKKGKDSKRGDHVEIPVYPYKDKYGSVSAHSTSAIYGALRAPHYHAICGPQDMWYASVRSLNRGIHRDVVYTTETYEWRETVYEEAPKEVFAVGPPPVEMIPRPPCMCVVRRRHPLEGASLSKSSRILPRCKTCAPPAISNGSLNNGQSSSKRASGTPEKIKSPILEEKVELKVESTSRMSGYKKFITGSKFKTPFKGISTKESRKISRKSILECDVTAYDLIKKVAKTPTVPEIDDSDIDDNLNDNAIAKINHAKRHNYENKPKQISPSNGSPRHAGINKRGTKFIKSQSENCIYSESQSVLVGGQRIFTDNHRSKSPTLAGNLNSGDEQEDMVSHLQYAKWRHLSVSDESVSIPDPDYDFSDDSDDGTVINSNYTDPKFTYSPPPIRKSMNDSHGLDYGSRELSKSMSSLQSDDTFVPSINLNKPNSSMWVSKPNDCDTLENDIENDIEKDCLSKVETSEDEANLDDRPTSPSDALNYKHDSKYESSSDCSSSGGTLSSDYPTWTSSSSNELKSILKNKKRRENIIKEAKDSSKLNKHLDESKASQKKKQVQFQPGCSGNATATAMDNAKDDGNPFNKVDDDSNTKQTTVINDIYETVAEATCDKSIQHGEMAADSFDSSRGAYVSVNNPFTVDECIDSLVACHIDKHNLPISSIKNSSTSNLDLPEGILSPEGKQTSLPPSLPPKLPPGRSSSLEDIRNGSQGGRDKKSKRSRTTLPKRRLSDLHLHSLLCPTRSSFCGNGSSSDDMPLTSATQRAHRSLPESPNELDEVSSFCFDFLEKGSKDKVLSSSRSVFYIPVDGDAQKSELNDSPAGNSSTEGPAGAAVVSPSIEDDGNQSFPKEEPVDACDMDGNVSTEHYDTDEDNLENDYENLDPIYEELSEVSNSAKRLLSSECEPKSFFEGASKTDILSYLADAKERGLSTEGLSEDEKVILEEEDEEEKVLSDDDPGEKNRVITNNSINHKEALLKIEEDVEKDETLETETEGAGISKSARVSEVERNDSGVGTETSKPSRMKFLATDWEEQLCADCDHQVEPVEDEESGQLFNPLVCRKCEFRRSERKEIIIEFVDTECKYGRDLRIIKEEFYRPMEIAGLLAKDQLLSIFLNLDELTNVNTKFSEKLQDALDIAIEHGDEDYTNVNIGKIFLETSSMLHAFETYCVKQASASVLLSHLEKEKELLRIFLRVSQMENTLLRRMNLPAFLMVPVQRVTRYPLLLSRLHKVTPIHHKDRNALKEAQQKVELHLEHINQQTKGVGGTKIWRRISNISASHRRLGKDIGSIKLRKMALEVLNWKQDEARFVIAGKLLFTQITDYPWNKKGKTVKFTSLHALLIALGKPNSNYRPESMSSDNPVLFPRNTGIRDASLVLMKEKNGRFIAVRDPLYLGNCVISCEPETDDVFEIQEYTTKEAYLLKGETKKDTNEWLRQLRYHAKDLGTWRRRRNALANIMINGMVRN